MEVNEKLPSRPAISSPVWEEKSLMDFDAMLPHIGEFGLYQELLFTSLASSAFFVYAATPEGHWWSPERMGLTVEQRLVSAQI